MQFISNLWSQMQPINIKVHNDQLVINVGMECNEQIIGFDGKYYYAEYNDGRSKLIRVYLASKQRLIKHAIIPMRFCSDSRIKIRVIEEDTYLHTKDGWYRLDAKFIPYEIKTQIDVGHLYCDADSYMTERYIIEESETEVIAFDLVQGDEIELGDGYVRTEYHDCIVIEDGPQFRYHFDNGNTVLYPPYMEIKNAAWNCITSKGIIIGHSNGQIDFIDFSHKVHILQPNGNSSTTIRTTISDYFAIIANKLVKIYHIQGIPVLIHEQTMSDAFETCIGIVFNVVPILNYKPNNLMLNNKLHSDLNVVCFE